MSGLGYVSLEPPVFPVRFKDVVWHNVRSRGYLIVCW